MKEFTTIVAHDLRAPLRHITCYAQRVIEDASYTFCTAHPDRFHILGVLLGLVVLQR
jgi:light-regulated signal transduction histidine kinase (bacteriophytochrome)